MTQERPIEPAWIRNQFTAVQEGVARAVRDAGRTQGDVTLVAVSKLFPADAIRPVLDLGAPGIRRELRAGGDGEMA